MKNLQLLLLLIVINLSTKAQIYEHKVHDVLLATYGTAFSNLEMGEYLTTKSRIVAFELLNNDKTEHIETVISQTTDGLELKKDHYRIKRYGTYKYPNGILEVYGTNGYLLRRLHYKKEQNWLGEWIVTNTIEKQECFSGSTYAPCQIKGEWDDASTPHQQTIAQN
jgi:hypothetical protein